MTGEFEPGQRFGAYELGKQIGRGGMGVVYEANHVHLGRTVALKLLTPELSQSADFRERFLRESRLAAKIEHPAVITVYDAGDVDGVLYLAMRYIRGTDLAAVLAERGPLGIDETLSIIEQVAGALDTAHAAGLVHRDVKPANVMLEDDRCFLGDFGLTRRTDDTRALTSTGQFLGTAAYVAPEQIEGREIDGRTDVYALGCLLFECLTGSRPFQRDSELAVLYAHLHDPPPRPTALRPELPAAFDAVVERAMAKDMSARYPTSAALAVAATHASLGGVETPEQLATAPSAPAPTEYSAPPAPAPATAALPPEIRTGATAALPPSPAPRRRLPVVPIALVALLAVVAVVAILAASGGEDKKKAPVASVPRVVKSIPIDGRPEGITSSPGSLWIADNENNEVIRVNPDGSEPKPFHVDDYPYGMASNSTSVWVASATDNWVTRIVTSTEQKRHFPVGPYPLFLTADDNVVYVANAGNKNDAHVEGSVTKLDAQTGQQMGDAIQVGKKPLSIVTGQGSVWVANRDSGTVSRITDGKPVKPIDVEGNPTGLAYHDGSVWVAGTVSNSVTRIDTSNDKADDPIPVGQWPYAVGYFGDALWVANRDDGTIWRLDPDTGEKIDEVSVPGEPVGMTTLDGDVFVTARAARKVYRIKP